MNPLVQTERRHFLLLALILLAGLGIRVAFFIGYEGFDDRTYVAYAQHFANGGDVVSIGLHDHWIGRIGAWLPLGLLLKTFGGGPWVLAFYSLAASLGGILLIFVLGKTCFDSRHGLMAAALLAVFPLDVLYSTRSFADAPLGFWCLSATALYLLPSNSQWPCLLAGVSAGIAYLTKETSVLLGIPLAVSILYTRKIEWRKCTPLALGFSSMLVFELLFWGINTGNPLYRWKSALATRDSMIPPKVINSVMDMVWGPMPHEIFRSSNTFLEAILMFATNEEFGFLYYFVLPIAAVYTFKKSGADRTLALVVVSVTPFLLFFPFHFPTYTLDRDPRYYTIISGPALVLFTAWVFRLEKQLRHVILAGLVLTWLPCLLVGYLTSGAWLQRQLVTFIQAHPADRVWMSNRFAADTMILSHAPHLNLGVHCLDEGAPKDCAASSPVRALSEGIPIARDAGEAQGGYVVLRDRPGTVVPDGWQFVKQIPAGGDADLDSSFITRTVQHMLIWARVPNSTVARLAPWHGEALAIYRPRQ
jgi:4-amino-4-deoxy-L-arabinose transferase-like glycosyltransferase